MQCCLNFKLAPWGLWGRDGDPPGLMGKKSPSSDKNFSFGPCLNKSIPIAQ